MADTKVAITPEQFYEIAQTFDDPVELVDGEVVRMVRPGARHALISGNVIGLLGHLLPSEQYRVFVDVGWQMPTGNVRGPDACVILADLIREKGVPIGFWTERIDLAVEVIGAQDRAAELDRKTEEYFAAGARQVWRINPETQKIAIYRSPKQVQIFGIDDEVDAADFHAVLRFPARRIFE